MHCSRDRCTLRPHTRPQSGPLAQPGWWTSQRRRAAAHSTLSTRAAVAHIMALASSSATVERDAPASASPHTVLARSDAPPTCSRGVGRGQDAATGGVTLSTRAPPRRTSHLWLAAARPPTQRARPHHARGFKHDSQTATCTSSEVRPSLDEAPRSRELDPARGAAS